MSGIRSILSVREKEKENVVFFYTIKEVYINEKKLEKELGWNH